MTRLANLQDTKRSEIHTEATEEFKEILYKRQNSGLAQTEESPMSGSTLSLTPIKSILQCETGSIVNQSLFARDAKKMIEQKMKQLKIQLPQNCEDLDSDNDEHHVCSEATPVYMNRSYDFCPSDRSKKFQAQHPKEITFTTLAEEDIPTQDAIPGKMPHSPVQYIHDKPTNPLEIKKNKAKPSLFKPS